MSILRWDDMKPREETDDTRIERADMFLSEIEAKERVCLPPLAESQKRTYVARVAVLLDEIKSTNPIVFSWKTRATERMNAAAKSLGMV